MKNTPSFQYYPADLISDPDVMFWDMEMVGAYWQMITYLWLNGGEFTLNIDNLRMIFHQKIGRTSLKLWQKIAHKFAMIEQCSGDVKITIVTHKRITAEMQKQAEKRVKQSNGGKKGMANRWEGHKLVTSKLITSGITSDNSSTSTSIALPPELNKISPQQENHKIAFEDLTAYWNSKTRLPKIRGFTEERKRKLSIRSKEQEFYDNWKLLIDLLDASDFHTGNNDRNWIATIDYLLANTKYLKLLESHNPNGTLFSNSKVCLKHNKPGIKYNYGDSGGTTKIWYCEECYKR